MDRTSLSHFLAVARSRFLLTGMPQRSYVHEPGFHSLYVRITQRVVQERLWKPVLDIASVQASIPGKGAFQSLLGRFEREYPTLPLYVENVLSPRFAQALIRFGFVDLGPEVSPCFFLPPEGHHAKDERGAVEQYDSGPVQNGPRS